MQHTTFSLVYGKETIMPMEFLVPSLCIALMTKMTKKGALEKRLKELMELEQDRIIAGYHQQF